MPLNICFSLSLFVLLPRPLSKFCNVIWLSIGVHLQPEMNQQYGLEVLQSLGSLLLDTFNKLSSGLVIYHVRLVIVSCP